MKSNKGQALLEFVLILPVLLMILLAIIDLGRILYEKNRMENVLSDVGDMLTADLSVNEIQSKLDNEYHHKILLDVDYNEDDITIGLQTDINIYTPGLDRVLSDPYRIEASRVIYDE